MRVVFLHCLTQRLLKMRYQVKCTVNVSVLWLISVFNAHVLID